MRQVIQYDYCVDALTPQRHTGNQSRSVAAHIIFPGDGKECL